MKTTTIFFIMMLIISAALTGCAQQEAEVMKSSGTQEVVTKESPKMTYTEAKTTTTTTTDNSMSFDEEEAKAMDAAETFVKNLEGYSNQQGRKLQVQSAVKLKCAGCWVVDMTFERDLLYYPDKVEFITVHVELKNWKMESYTFG